ncbi:DUF6232 family protein [Pelomonas sp. Root1444]|uniref:DUF6232 family protein n=1 Tax=Pelomonas sp. Root1444 TaxID=1736464 RepID=UPI000702A822|nr:DUF6232 family protein [Pelomonas sp. Root1444]KQY88263.1 hypothetical protein ASD35_11765 [Pelomonas sp. Root1444]
MDEKVFFEHGSVQVTNARFKVDEQTYAVRNITSTAAWSKPQSWALPLLLLLSGFVAFSSKDGIGAGVLLLLVAAALFYFGRPWHFVKLSTASGEVKALKSRDKNYVLQVVNALNDAMVSQHKSA